MDTLIKRAVRTLKDNDRGTHTVPSPRLYPHQWAWDSAFAAIGWVYVDPDRAVTELESLLRAGWTDGRVPHIRFNPREKDYAPGPDQWGNAESSTITQPPIWATAAWILLERGANPDRLRALIPGIEASHAFFHAQRDPLGLGLVAVVHPWESGRDNGPEWDLPMADVTPEDSLPFKRKDLDSVDDPGERPTDLDYRRYMALVKGIRDDDFGPGLFAVYDPMMTAILARAEADLARLADALGVESEAAARGERLREALFERLWDPDAGRFRFLDAPTGRSYAPDVLAAYIPLILEPTQQIRDRLVAGLKARYATPVPLPSTAPDSPAFDAHRYWRGPSWVNMNWLLVPALGGDLADRTLEIVESNGFWEYYHPETGEGLGADRFTWTAALVLDLLRSRQ